MAISYQWRQDPDCTIRIQAPAKNGWQQGYSSILYSLEDLSIGGYHGQKTIQDHRTGQLWQGHLFIEGIATG